MVFHPPTWLPQLPELPDDITLEEFMNNEKYGRHKLATSRNPYTCGITGETYTAAEVVQRTDHLSRAIGKKLRWVPGDNSKGWGRDAMGWDRVVAMFSFNTIDYIPVTHAVHRLGGIVTPASAAYSPSEFEHQIRSSGARAIFTCVPLLDVALRASRVAGIPDEAIFILPMPGGESRPPFKSVDELVAEGKGLPPVSPLRWDRGRGARQVTYLCYSSGTSGFPKAVMISHLNTIANVVQDCTFDSVARRKYNIDTQVSLGLLPLSHIYGLSVVALVSQYRGDEVIILPRFELRQFLGAIGRFRVEHLCVVPPVLMQMASHQDVCDEHDLRSVRLLYCGAAPLGHELLKIMLQRYPKINIVQGYGLTESSALVLSTSELDPLPGSSGSLIPGTKAKIIDTDGNEVHSHKTQGELLLQSPSVTLGYLDDERATSGTFVWHTDGRWLKTGDEVLVQRSPEGNEHFLVVDRIKEMIKVKGLQVAPAELEAHLLAHSFVSDCAVIPVPHERAGEVPKAFVVKSNATAGVSGLEITKALVKHVEQAKSKHKWLRGGVKFIKSVPRSPSGKILRRRLRDKEKETCVNRSSKL